MPLLRAVTWNVLADAYLTRERYPKSSDTSLEPARRHAKIVERILSLDPDLLLLQELEEPVYARIRAALPSHESHYARRRNRKDGSAIFARRQPLEWRGARELHYDAHRPHVDDLALIAELRLEGRRLLAASTHLTWQPLEMPEAEHIGRLQLLELLAATKGAPRILGGDFNAEPGSLVLAAAAGLIDESTQSTYEGRKIDFLLHSKDLRGTAPGAQPLPEPMPSEIEPSDHWPQRLEIETL